MYADKMTDSMKYAIDETQRRREIQTAHNENMVLHRKRFINGYTMLSVLLLRMMKQMHKNKLQFLRNDEKERQKQLKISKRNEKAAKNWTSRKQQS